MIFAAICEIASNPFQQINAENAGFDCLISQLKAEQESELEHLKAQLRLANKLIDFTVWHDTLCAELSARIAVAEAAENLINPKTLIRGSEA